VSGYRLVMAATDGTLPAVAVQSVGTDGTIYTKGTPTVTDSGVVPITPTRHRSWRVIQTGNIGFTSRLHVGAFYLYGACGFGASDGLHPGGSFDPIWATNPPNAPTLKPCATFAYPLNGGYTDCIYHQPTMPMCVDPLGGDPNCPTIAGDAPFSGCVGKPGILGYLVLPDPAYAFSAAAADPLNLGLWFAWLGSFLGVALGGVGNMALWAYNGIADLLVPCPATFARVFTDLGSENNVGVLGYAATFVASVRNGLGAGGPVPFKTFSVMGTTLTLPLDEIAGAASVVRPFLVPLVWFGFAVRMLSLFGSAVKLGPVGDASQPTSRHS